MRGIEILLASILNITANQSVIDTPFNDGIKI